MGLFGSWTLSAIASVMGRKGGGPLWDAVGFVLPYVHRDALWHPDLATLLPACAVLVGLGAAYLAIGLVPFGRRDL